ncbi:YopX family protein [Campylobacter estrildidarum]|uniref:YopX protein domain-containing protein n=1 Tax=Campylobacter estrildidarum TaxID=2510189 RepID=A0A4V6DX16_9BACT|nr:YopX family protein [Campylobacter estrildidarum]TKX29492.1 hypothetical protein CQA69_07265 [Campylobacter estrildidarum]
MKLKDFDFRVWDKGINKYIENQTIAILNNRIFAGNTHEGQIGEFEFMSENYDNDIEIELWTGFYDKNGKKIYEGDIIRCEYHDGCILTYIIIFKYGSFYASEYNSSYIDLISEISLENYEIIGNIHENPELLKC